MALVKVTFASGETVELEMEASAADNLVSSFARFVKSGAIPENRTILSPSESFYLDFSKVALVRREF